MTHAPLAALSLLLFTPAGLAQTIYVDANLNTGANDGSSWADAYQGQDGLLTALAAAAPGEQVFVAEGTYRPSDIGLRAASFRLESGVELYGGFLGTESSPDERPPFGSAPSVLTGDLNGDDGGGSLGDNSFHVVNGAGSNATAVLDGFTVRAGNANSGGGNDRGGGILCINGSSPTVRNCLFIANRSTFGGGAGYINGSAPTFTNTGFQDNLGGTFGGAFDIATAGAVRYESCWFVNNRASRAGALEVFATNGVVVVNCLFHANVATGANGGGAMWMGSGGNTRVRNCTVIGNQASAQTAGGLRVQGAAPTVANCIFWNNQGQGGAQGSVNQIQGTTNVTYTIVEGGLAGTGNLGLDPQLADVPGDDFRLTLASPAVDAGINANVPAGITVDLDGNPRFVDVPSVPDTGAGTPPLVDMGAYELPAPGLLAYCFGDGAGTPCPCGNDGAAGNGCANGTFAGGANLSSSGSPSVSNDTLVLVATQSTPSQPGIFFQGDNATAGGNGLAFGDGLRCAGGNVCRIEVVNADANGDASTTISIAARCSLTAGDLRRMQWWYRDPNLTPCMSGFNLSNGLEATWTP